MNSKSFTIFEIIIVMLVVGIISALAAPKVVDLVNEARRGDELNTVGNVKSGIALTYLGNVTRGITPQYPQNLDNATLAKASPTNPIYDLVLQHGITKGWEKLEQYRYRGPTGQEYEFDPLDGTFETVEVIPPPPPVPLYLSSTFGGTGYEYLNSILLTPDGGYILAGYTDLSPGLGNPGDFYVVKVDAYGNKVWEETYGGGSQEVPSLMQETSDGGYIMVGWTASYGVGRDAYIVKMDSSGNMEWQKNLGGAGTDEGLGIQQTSDGGYIMSGYATSPETGIQDAYLVKLNSSGDTEWENMYGGIAPDFFDSIQETTDGYVVAGATSSYLNDTSDAYLIKINSSGTIEWQNTFGSAEYDGVYDLQKTSDGGYIMAGSTSSSGLAVSTMYLVKTDSLGNLQWEKRYSEGFSGAWEGAQGVQQTSDGGYIMVGSTQSGYGSGGGGNDVHLVKVDSSGTTQWQKMYGGTDGDNGLSVQVINDDGGNTIGYAVGASTQSFGAGSMDYWLIKTDANGNSPEVTWSSP